MKNQFDSEISYKECYMNKIIIPEVNLLMLWDIVAINDEYFKKDLYIVLLTKLQFLYNLYSESEKFELSN